MWLVVVPFHDLGHCRKIRSLSLTSGEFPKLVVYLGILQHRYFILHATFYRIILKGDWYVAIHTIVYNVQFACLPGNLNFMHSY